MSYFFRAKTIEKSSLAKGKFIYVLTKKEISQNPLTFSAIQCITINVDTKRANTMNNQEFQKKVIESQINEFGKVYRLTEREKEFLSKLLSKVPQDKIKSDIIAQFLDIIREDYN